MNDASIRSTGTLVGAAAIIIIIFGMQAAKDLLVPFLLAVFLALLAVRPMLWLQRHKVPSVLAALLLVSAMMLILAVVGAIIGTSVADFTAALPSYQARLEAIVDGALQFVARHVDDPSVASLGDIVNPGWAVGMAAGILNALRDVLTNTFLILFTTVFILLEASSFGTKVTAALGRSGETFERPRQFLDNLGRYLGIKTVVSAVTGLVVGLMTWAIGLDFPLLWGMLAFLLNYIPTIGSIIAAVPAVLIALVQLGFPEATTTAIGFVAVNLVFGNIVEPRLMGYGVGISPLIVFVGLVIWGWVFGPVGMLLSVPLTMTLKMGLESNENTRWIAILIGSERDAQYALSQTAESED